jgi:hypothetical protein
MRVDDTSNRAWQFIAGFCSRVDGRFEFDGFVIHAPQCRKHAAKRKQKSTVDFDRTLLFQKVSPSNGSK